jgi:hypothetical protein
MATFIPAPTQFSTVPSFQAPPFVSGFRIIVTGNTTFTVAPGVCRALTSPSLIQFPSFAAGIPATITVDVSTVGANGCYPNSIASLGLSHNTVYGVYICSVSSGTLASSSTPAVTTGAPIVVVATGNNFLPAGYDTFRRIGLVQIAHSTSYLIPMTQSGHMNERVYTLQDPFVALSAGGSTTPAVIDLTANDAPIVPNQYIDVVLNVEITPNAADGYVCVEPGALTAGTVSPTQIFGSVAGHKNSSYVRMTATPNSSTGNANIQYFVDNSSSASTINVCGFVDSIGNALF